MEKIDPTALAEQIIELVFPNGSSKQILCQITTLNASFIWIIFRMSTGC